MSRDSVIRLLNEIRDNSYKEVIVYALEGCPACSELKTKFDNIGLTYETVIMNDNEVMWSKLEEMGGSEYAPQVQVDGYLIKEEEYDDVNELISKTLTNLLGRKIVVS
jgi:glutaredoxin